MDKTQREGGGGSLDIAYVNKVEQKREGMGVWCLCDSAHRPTSYLKAANSSCQLLVPGGVQICLKGAVRSDMLGPPPTPRGGGNSLCTKNGATRFSLL